MIVCAAMLIGHMLSIGLVSIGRAGTGWAPETEKYLYYAAVVMVSSALIIWDAWQRNPIARIEILSVCAATAGLMLAHQRPALETRSFFRSIESGALSLALGIQHPSTAEALGGETEEVYKMARAHGINLFGRPPLSLIGREIEHMMRRNSCMGRVELTTPFASVGGAYGLRFEGWAIDLDSHQSQTILITRNNMVVGGAVFTFPRPDVLDHFRLTAPARDTTLGWIGYVPGVDVSILEFFIYRTGTDTVCRFSPSGN